MKISTADTTKFTDPTMDRCPIDRADRPRECPLIVEQFL
jgi:hypothetical protein